MLRLLRMPFMLGLLCLVVLLSFPVLTATAQDAGAAAPGAAAAVNAQPPDGTQVKPTGSYLTWFLRSSGLIGLFILVLSIYFVATVIRLFMDLRVDVAVPPGLLQQCEDLALRNDLQTVYNTIQADDSSLGHVLSAGLSELPYGLSESREAMDRMGESETVNMEKQISMLAVLGTLGPMIGLIGTLKGMISSFSVIAMSDVQLKASEVASGISEALLLTFEGVALSVPAIYFHALFRNRVSTISAATMVQADRILRHIARAARLTVPSSHSSSPLPASPPPAPSQGERVRAPVKPDILSTNG